MSDTPFKGKVVKTSVRKKDSLALSQGMPLFVADLDINPLGQILTHKSSFPHFPVFMNILFPI